MKNRIFDALCLGSIVGFAFFSVVPYAVAGRHISTGLMFLCALYFFYKKQLCLPRLSWLNSSFLLLFTVAMVSALLSPTMALSLKSFQTDTVPFGLAFTLLVCTRSDATEVALRVRVFIYSIVCGWLVKEGLAIRDGISNSFIFSIYEMPDAVLPRYLDFFATDTVFYLPILLGVAGFWPLRVVTRIFLWAAIICAIAVVAVSGVRTTFVMVMIELLLFLLMRFWHLKVKILIGLVIFAGITFAAKNHVTNPSIARYYSIFMPTTYVSDGSVSERYAIVRGVLEISEKRKWIGYGPGWKKLPVVAEDGGFMKEWAESNVPWKVGAFHYFSKGEGRVNPHNLYAQLIFEVGIFGLLAYLVMLVSLGASCVSALTRKVQGTNLGIAYAGIAYVTVYFVAGMSGGIWLPITLLVYIAWLSSPDKQEGA